jgi:hypothetical protein
MIRNYLKGQFHEIFDFRLFSWINFLQALSISLGLFRIFSQLKVANGKWKMQMEKILHQKSFNYFVWTPLGSRVNI